MNSASISISNANPQDLEKNIEAILNAANKAISGESTAYNKVGNEGILNMLRPMIEADLNVNEAEELLEMLKIIVKEVKISSMFTN